MPGRLSMVGTPIGNLEDISLRALRTLRECDLVLCEDTRVTRTLLVRHAIAGKELVRFDQHAPDAKVRNVLERLAAGAHVAFVTDAGTPGVSDPGGTLVARVAEALPEAAIEPIPGPSACTTLVSVAGIPADRYVFLGFLPQKRGRKALLAWIAAQELAVCFYESPHRIVRALEALAPLLGDRRIAVGRELTKLHETIYRGTARDVLATLTRGSTKGEYAVLIAQRT